MTRILFVDDEPRVLSGLRRQHHPLFGEAGLQFAAGGAQAQELLAQEVFDVLVTDLCMPDVDGTQLLGRVAERTPWTVRLVLSGHAEPERMQRARALAHGVLEKPCVPGRLQAEIRRALAVRETARRPDAAVLSKLWCTPPARVPAAQPLLPLMYGTPDSGLAQGMLEDLLASDPHLACRLERLLLAVRPAGRIPGTRVAARLLVALRLHAIFLAELPGGDGRMAAACKAAAAARAAGCAADDVTAATITALLAPAGAPAGTGAALAFLLPAWGLPAEPAFRGQDDELVGAARPGRTQVPDESRR